MMIGKKVGHYEIVAVLGRGGMGIVYRAIDARLGRPVALKFLPEPLGQDPGALARFSVEARAASSLNHPNICSLYDIDEFEGRPFIVMECLSGQSLRKKLESGPLGSDDLLHLAIQAAKGLEAAHERGIVHRDIKPDNIFVGEDSHVKILDFGVARAMAPLSSTSGTITKLTADGLLAGTVNYMSPEQLEGRVVDGRSDLFSLGIVLYEAGTGRHPFARSSWVETARAIVAEPHPPVERAVEGRGTPWVGVVSKLLEKSPENRFQTPADLLVELRRVDQEVQFDALLAARSSDSTPGWRTVVRRRWLPVLTVLLIVLGVAAFFLLRPTPERPDTTIAFLPLEYEGPESHRTLAYTLPAALRLELRSPGWHAAPLDSSGGFSQTEDRKALATQLGVSWIVGGKLKVDDHRYTASVSLFGPGQQKAWSQKIEGPVDQLLSGVTRLVPGLARVLALEPHAPPKPEGFEDYVEGCRYLEGWDASENFERAKEAFSRAVAKGGLPEAHAGLALALWGEYEQSRDPGIVSRAKQVAEIAVTLAPDSPESHLALGVVQLGVGSSAAAAASFARAQSLAPADDAVCRRIGKAYGALNRREDAEKAFAQAIALRPDYWENYNERGAFYLNSGRLEEAKEDFNRVVKLRPKANIGYTNLAGAYILAGQPKEAEAPLLAALNLQPSFHVHNNLGFVYYSLGRFAESAEQFLAATKQAGGAFEPWVNLGEAYRHLPDPTAAQSAYRKGIELTRAVLKVRPDDAIARSALAVSLAGCGECEEAAREVRTAVSSHKEDPQVHYQAAVALAVCGNGPGAIKHLKKVLETAAVADIRTNPDLSPFLPGLQASAQGR